MAMIGRNIKKWWNKFADASKDLLQGTPAKIEAVSNLRPEQENLYSQFQQGLANQPGGAFGPSMDYYRSILSNEAPDYEQFAAPEMRRFNQQIMPDIAEQFAGMGAGGLGSSGFQNAAAQAGVDLSERLAAMRAGLRQHAAQGLSQIGQYGLSPFSQNMVTQEGTEGLLPEVARGAGQAIGLYAKSKLGIPSLPSPGSTAPAAAASASAPMAPGGIPQPTQPYWANPGANMKRRLSNYSGTSAPPYGTSPYGMNNPMSMQRF